MSKYSSFSTDNINIRPTNSQNAGTSNYSSTQGAVTGCTGCGGSSTNACAAANSRIISGGGKRRGRKRTRRAGRSKRFRRSRRAGRSRRARRSRQYGGKGYSMSNTQTIHANNKVPEQTSYSNPGISSSLNLGASKQYAGLQKGGRRRGRRGGKSGDVMRYDTWSDYFGFKDTGGNLGTFAGSGYPPYTRGSNNSCPNRGGKRRRRTRRTRR
jgi:hypothetical protein